MRSSRDNNNAVNSATNITPGGNLSAQIHNSFIPFIEEYDGNPDEQIRLASSRQKQQELARIKETARKKAEEEIKRKVLEEEARKKASTIPDKKTRSSAENETPYYSTQHIMKITGFPAKNHPKSIYDFTEALKNPHRSFHDVDIVHKKGWHLYALSAMKADFDQFKPDSYLLMREKSAPWHLLYLDENRQLSIIEINQIPNLSELLARRSPEQLTETDILALKRVIKVYRTNIQKKKSPNTETKYFFKNSAIINSEMTWLEAVNCGFYQLLAPHHVSSTKAIHDENNAFVAASSKGIPCFKSAREDPLRDEDLYIEALEKGYITIEELDLIDKRVRDEGLQLEKFDKNRVITGKIVSAKEGNKNEENKPKSIQVTVKDLRNYRIVKGLAIGLTTSRINNEDDNHARNISKYGVRIDFDMSWWNIVYKFKSSGIVDWAFRYPSKNRFVVTENDIRHFPNLKDSVPFYWPTNPAPYIPEYVLNALASIFSISQNAFSAQENLVYQKLETHRVFIYHKFATLLKYILTEADMYRNIFKLHAREDVKFEGKYIIDMFTEEHGKQIKAFRDILTNMPEFREFMRHHGESVFKSIIAEFADRNAKFERKIQRIDAELADLAETPDKFMAKFAVKRAYREQYIPLRQTRRTFEAIFKETMDKEGKNQTQTQEDDLSKLLAKSLGRGK